MKRLTDELRKIILSGSRDPRAFDILNELEKRFEKIENENRTLRSQNYEKKKESAL